MADPVTIAVDALGGDNAPDVVLDGCAAALDSDKSLTIILSGPECIVTPFASTHERCLPLPATQSIAMDEHPATAVRKKKDSSLVVGCRAVREGRAAGFFSAGSTGACLAAATLVIGRSKGVMRPALATVIPSPVKPVILCDVGANADCKPEYLVQFAQMASIYSEAVLGTLHPRIGLLNIGSEETKGSVFAQESFMALREHIPSFAGNAEGDDILKATFDVVVCDGFSGNICLKTIEGTAEVLFSALKDSFLSSLKTKIAAAAMKDSLKRLKNSISAETYGGAPLLGCSGACIVGHGSSNAKAIKNGIATTATTVRQGVILEISDALGSSSV